MRRPGQLAARIALLALAALPLTVEPSALSPRAEARRHVEVQDMPPRFERLARRCSSQMQLAAGISLREPAPSQRRGRRASPGLPGTGSSARRQGSRRFPEVLLRWSSQIQGTGKREGLLCPVALSVSTSLARRLRLASASARGRVQIIMPADPGETYREGTHAREFGQHGLSQRCTAGHPTRLCASLRGFVFWVSSLPV